VCTPTPSTFAARDATSITRSRFRGSTGPPSSVVKTSPEFCYWFADRNRSAVWTVRCRRSIATTAGFSGESGPFCCAAEKTGRPSARIDRFRCRTGTLVGWNRPF
jgi:hypothetical protein